MRAALGPLPTASVGEHERALPRLRSLALRVVGAQTGAQEQDYSIIHKIIQKERALGTVAPTVPTHPPWYYGHSTQILI